MKVSNYSVSSGFDGTTAVVEFRTNDKKEGSEFCELLDTAYRSGKEVVGNERTITPEKIFRCGDVTTVIWKDGTKTIVKLMPGADDSDYGAFTAALAKKIYGNNSKVMRYAGMVQRVKSKAEKKAERKAKHKAESEDSDYKKYIVSQYGQVAECKGVETEEIGVGEKVVVYATTEDHARVKACKAFKEMGGMREYLVYSNRDLCRTEIAECEKLGKWCESAVINAEFIRVFAKNRNEALRVLDIIPAPIPF